jgi:hypothetical protein
LAGGVRHCRRIFSGLGRLAYLLFQWFKHRHREEYSLGFVLMEIQVPRDNEIKIDAAEQMFSALSTLHHSGFWSFMEPGDHFAFEIVGRKEDIRFYVTCPKNCRTYWKNKSMGPIRGRD